MINNVGERIKYLRDKLGYTQTYLAKKLGISRSAVNGWEMSIAVPSLTNIIELTKIFNVSSDYLLCLDDRLLVDISGLTNEERETLMRLIECFKNR
ncbi:MAG: helix-turn-helix transcriptional regulator [Clostridia bacterium]|nr:helix-turn-helix transcriptional regulator [Clostridia bacterium]